MPGMFYCFIKIVYIILKNRQKTQMAETESTLGLRINERPYLNGLLQFEQTVEKSVT